MPDAVTAVAWFERSRATLLVDRGILAVAVAVLALALRLAAPALQGPTAPDWDARIAQNLHDGVGNVTLRCAAGPTCSTRRSIRC